jgi:hypothetical protein
MKREEEKEGRERNEAGKKVSPRKQRKKETATKPASLWWGISILTWKNRKKGAERGQTARKPEKGRREKKEEKQTKRQRK